MSQDPRLLTEYAAYQLILEHFISRPDVERLAELFMVEINGMKVAPDWAFIMMLKARSVEELDLMHQQQEARKLLKQLQAANLGYYP